MPKYSDQMLSKHKKRMHSIVKQSVGNCFSEAMFKKSYILVNHPKHNILVPKLYMMFSSHPRLDDCTCRMKIREQRDTEEWDDFWNDFDHQMYMWDVQFEAPKKLKF